MKREINIIKLGSNSNLSIVQARVAYKLVSYKKKRVFAKNLVFVAKRPLELGKEGRLCTLLRNHIQPERSGTDRFFSYYPFSYIYGLFHCIFKIFH